MRKLLENAKKSVAIALLLAANPLTSPELLQQLAKRRDYSVRRTLTANPNTPTKVLLRLGEYFPEELLHNPMWSLILFENLNILNQIPKATLRSLLNYDLKNDKHLIPAYCLQKLANHQDYTIRYYVAQHPQASVEILEKLAVDVEEWVRGSVALHPATPVYILEKLAVDSEPNVRQGVASNPNTPVHLLEKLLEDTVYTIPSSVAKNPNTPIYILERLVDNNSLITAVASNIKTPGYILENIVIKNSKKYLQDDKLEHIFSRVASHPNTPAHVMENLSKNHLWQVRNSIASSPYTPVYILEKLAEDRIIQVRESIASNSNTPAYILEKLAEDSETSETSMLRCIACNLKAPASLLERMPESPIQQWTVLKAIAKNPNTPVKVLKYLIKDRRTSISSAAASNLYNQETSQDH